MAWLSPDMKKTIVMIGEPRSNMLSARPVGSGTLIRNENRFFVITVKHVIKTISDPLIIFNDVKGRIKGYRTSYLKSELGSEWKYHHDNEVDLAAIRFGYEEGDDDVRIIPSDMFIEFKDIIDGEDVFFMGFPLGLTNLNMITPAVRQGCVSLKLNSETKIGEIRYAPKTIIIDGQVSRGNSGSPVFRKSAPSRTPILFGIVTSHIESIILDLHGNPIAKENSGLGIVSSADHIIDLITLF